ncbi:hypothetical protein Tel_02645 [Candidatus Tenderia electrophaga]|mgnify:CR=1 FL=1|jgi:UPF0716 protein FxsA|uniref:Exlusion protein FxsA n=1 Tax=Candidatus Tenderia electrophaga TaxID=1748243 RepID=A0A0S2TAH1_9GAMM|nr:hypothetical protein Tel_02645 [Candidatus Tenderia electrophaga]
MFSFRSLLALFLIVPLFEIYLLIKVGGVIGAIPTVFMVVFTAVVGALLLRQQGFSVLARVQAMLVRGEIPAIEILEGVMLLFGGALLLTPGFFTDTIGFICLITPLRRRIILWALRRGIIGPGDGPPRRPQGPRTLEGEYWRDRDRNGRD